MGFENREYYRESEGGGFLSGGIAGIGTATKYLIAANIVVFLAQVLTTGGGGDSVTRWLEFDAAAVRSGEVWRVVTWGFGYSGSPLTFIFEMLFLWWFGKAIEEMVGTRELALLYFAAILLGSAVAFAAAAAAGFRVPIPVIGATVPVLAITVLFAWHYPMHQILLFFIIPVPIWILIAIVVAVSLVNSAQSGWAGGPFLAELSAVGLGLAYGKLDRRFENLIPAGRPSFRLPKRRPKLRVFEPEQKVDLDRKVDEILAKIHEQGEASLTARERKTLEEASRRYKKT